jgi:hypothetical protein
MEMSSADRYFENLRSAIRAADSVNSMITLMADDVSNEAGKETYGKHLRWIANKRFKGKVEPFRSYCLKVINELEENYLWNLIESE